VRTTRTVRPLALVYHLECVMLAPGANCAGFRHFRTDRIYECRVLDQSFAGQGDALRAIWPDQDRWGIVEPGMAEPV
jgi:predicted DNA-binding transcriptional regulator YafY